jgi:hypothetical protein
VGAGGVGASSAAHQEVVAAAPQCGGALQGSCSCSCRWHGVWGDSSAATSGAPRKCVLTLLLLPRRIRDLNDEINKLIREKVR